VLLKIADIVAAHDAEFAFPTQTLQLQTPEALEQLAQEQQSDNQGVG
jgi:hypothetical protein